MKEIDSLFEIIYEIYEKLDGDNKFTEAIKNSFESETIRKHMIERLDDATGYIEKIADYIIKIEEENKKLIRSRGALQRHNDKYRDQISELKEKHAVEIQKTKERFARGGRPPISYEIKEMVVDLHRRGSSLRKIAEICNISKSSVENIIKEFEKDF